MLDGFRRDLAYALRGLRRSRGFTVTVIATLGLGIGANAAMFGVVDRLMFRRLPYLRDPGSVHRVYLQSTVRGRVVTSTVFPYARYLDLSEFGVEDDDEDPLENDYVRDYVADLALHDGWVRVMVRGDQVGIQLATTTAKAKAALRRYIRGLPASTYTFENAERTASEMFHTNGEAMRYIARLPERPPELD